MARSHARIYTSIWSDADFTALPPDAQRMFLFLVSQPDLEHSGIIALRERRWSRSSAALSPEDVRKALGELAAARFVVYDEDTEELLVRSLMRWDGVWKQPNVAKAAGAQIRTVASAELRRELRTELMRLEGDVHPDAEGLRQGLIGDLAGKPDLTPENPSPAPSVTPSGTPSATPSRRVQGKGNTGSTTAGSPAPSPSASPDPVPPPAADDAAASVTAQALVAEWLDHCRKRPPDRVIGQVAKELAALLAEGQDAGDVRAGLARWHQAGKHPSTLASFVNEVMNASPSQRASPGSRQQETDAMFDRAMQRAREREERQRDA